MATKRKAPAKRKSTKTKSSALHREVKLNLYDPNFLILLLIAVFLAAFLILR